MVSKDILLIVGARPNFIKAYPVYKELKNKFKVKVIHTGQHYNKELSKDITSEIGLKINYNLHCNTSNRCEIIDSLYEFIKDYNQIAQVSLIIVFGDINSAFAGAWVAKKLGIKLAHVESGLRSGDFHMEEEMNRYYIDSVSDLLFVTEKTAVANLNKEFNNKNLIFVGNTMIDTLREQLSHIKKHKEKHYGLVTFHRKENLIYKEKIKIVKLLNQLEKNNIKLKIFAHPNFIKEFQRFDIKTPIHKAIPYIEFLQEIINASFILTDSGGLQEEGAFLSIPCITYRKSTERPITVYVKKNIVTQNHKDIIDLVKQYIKFKPGKINPSLSDRLWGDGKASLRIANNIIKYLRN